MPLDRPRLVERPLHESALLESIGARIAAHPAIETCLAIEQSDRSGRNILIVYYVTKIHGQPVDIDLIRYLRSTLKPPEMPFALIQGIQLPHRFYSEWGVGSGGAGLAATAGGLQDGGSGVASVAMPAASADGETICGACADALAPEASVSNAVGVQEWQRPAAELVKQPIVAEDRFAKDGSTAFRSWLSSTPPSSRAVVCLRAGSGNPVFMVSGHELYQAVADQLDTDRPVLGIDLRWRIAVPDVTTNLNDILPVFNVKTIVDEHIAVIKRYQPAGPYALAGASLGGLIALEVARELARSGDKVQLVGMIDTFPPDFSKHLTFKEKLVGHVISTLRQGVKPLLIKVSRRASASTRKIAGLRAKVSADPGIMVWKENNICPAAWIKSRYDGQVLLMTPECRAPFAPTVDDYGWSECLSNLKLARAPGEHISMMRLGSGEIAKEISALL